MKLAELIDKLPHKIEMEVLNATLEQLNSILKYGEDTDFNDLYDSSNDFRRKVISKGYQITKLFKVYYSGWECDQWACEAVMKNRRFKINTNHGTLEIEEIK